MISQTTHLIIRPRDNEPRYTRPIAAQLARISLELLRRCEEERLIRAQVMPGGARGYSNADLEELARIRRLQEDLELDLTAVEVVLHMRQQMLALLTEMADMERHMARREQELLNEISRLRRRVAEEVY